MNRFLKFIYIFCNSRLLGSRVDPCLKTTLYFFGTSVRRSSRSAFGRLTGNDVSGHYKRHYFLFFSFFFLRRLIFSQKECSDQKLILRKLMGASKKSSIDTFKDPVGHFDFGPPNGHFGFFRWCGVAGSKPVHLLPLGWYRFKLVFNN